MKGWTRGGGVRPEVPSFWRSIRSQPELRAGGTRAGLDSSRESGRDSRPVLGALCYEEACKPDLTGFWPGPEEEDTEAQRSDRGCPRHTVHVQEAAEQVSNSGQRDPRAFAFDVTLCDTSDAEDSVRPSSKPSPGNDFSCGLGHASSLV